MMNRGSKGKPSVIYFIKRYDGLIKIGTTTNLPTRLATISKSHGALDILKIINGNRIEERRIQNKFSHDNVFGEWFRPTEDLLLWIRQAESGQDVFADAPEENSVWAAGELEMADLARTKARRLVQIRRQMFGAKNETQAIEGICKDHGIRRWFFKALLAGRSQSIGAFAFREIEKALWTDLEAALEHLKGEIDDMDDMARAEALAAEVKAKKQALKPRKPA